MLEDDIRTLAYGHKDVAQRLEADHDPPSVFDQFIPSKEAKRLGMHWQRRARCVKEIGYDPALQVEDTEEDASAARDTMRERVADMINQIPDPEYQFMPQDDRTPKSIRIRGNTNERPRKEI